MAVFVILSPIYATFYTNGCIKEKKVQTIGNRESRKNTENQENNYCHPELVSGSYRITRLVF